MFDLGICRLVSSFIKNVATKEIGIRRSLQEATELAHAVRYMHVGKHTDYIYVIQNFG